MLIALLIAWLLFVGHIVVRTHKVAAYRQELLDKVSAAADRDIRIHHRDWAWRFEALQAVSFEKMLFQFWKPLESFYPSKEFLK